MFINKKSFIFLVTLLLSVTIFAETGIDLIDKVRQRAIWIDINRFPNGVLLDFINTRQVTLGTLGKTKERDSIYALATGIRKHGLPGDFFLIEAVERNPDPQQASGGTNTHKIIDFVPRRELGRRFVADENRPAAYSIWNDSLWLNRASDTGFDTLDLIFFAYPTPLADSSDDIDLPTKFLPLLEDYLIKMCFDRVNISIPDTLNRSIQFLENQLFSRSRDE